MIFISEFLIFTLTIAYNVQLYSSKDIPRYIKLLVFLSWILCFIVILVLPFDIYFVFYVNLDAVPRAVSKRVDPGVLAFDVLGHPDPDLDTASSGPGLRTVRLLF